MLLVGGSVLAATQVVYHASLAWSAGSVGWGVVRREGRQHRINVLGWARWAPERLPCAPSAPLPCLLRHQQSENKPVSSTCNQQYGIPRQAALHGWAAAWRCSQFVTWQSCRHLHSPKPRPHVQGPQFDGTAATHAVPTNFTCAMPRCCIPRSALLCCCMPRSALLCCCCCVCCAMQVGLAGLLGWAFESVFDPWEGLPAGVTAGTVVLLCCAVAGFGTSW